MGKRYYWLKLKDDFFRQLPMKKLRRIAGGDTYTIIYLKMMLVTTKTDGVLGYEGAAADFISNLALDIDEDEENVEVTVQFLLANKLMVELEDGNMLLPEAKEAVGSEQASAQRVREFRSREKAKALQCNTAVTNSNIDVTEAKQIGNGEIEIEKEIEKDIDVVAVVNTNNISKGSDSSYNPINDLQYTLGFLPTGYQAESFVELYNEVGEVAYHKALEKAAKAGVKNYNYVAKAARGVAAGVDFDEKSSKSGSSGLDFEAALRNIKD